MLLRNHRVLSPIVLMVLIASACSSSGESSTPTPEAPVPVEQAAGELRTFPPAPAAPDGPLDPDDIETIESMIRFASAGFGADLPRQLETNGDTRLLWVLADWLRFTQGTPTGIAIVETAEALAGIEFDRERPWGDVTDHLFAWDLPAPPDYREYKAGLFTTIDDRWAFVFDDPDATIDYRFLGWGGVLIDDRPLRADAPCRRGCIPSLDDPRLTEADGGDWYPDDAVIFGVEINDESVAFPKNIMEIHEMVNMTIGDRRIGMPYCTLCGSAQAFFTDEVEGVERPPVLRTSGLLSRSNKVMYDLDSKSVFDTFTGEALSGPLREAGVTLPQATVVTTTWGDWKATHPDTRVIAEGGGLGRSYSLDPLGGRDDDGPIFPIGEVDPRLPVQEQVLGVDVPDGGFVAFPVEAARATLQNGDTVSFGDVVIELDGAGLRARVGDDPIPSHQAFWFAWSQFRPDTDLWLP